MAKAKHFYILIFQKITIFRVKELVVFLSLLTLSCTNTDDIERSTNVVELKINDISFNGKEVTIDWDDYVNENGDSIYYELYINNNFVKELNQSSSTINLDYNSNYEGKIVATNKRNSTVEITFSFNSPASEILFFSDNFGDLVAYDLLGQTVLWKSKTLTTEEVHSIRDNKIYSGKGGINAFDIFTGNQVWTSNPNPSFGKVYNDILADESHVYAFDSDSNLHCVEVASEDIVWDVSFSNHTAPLTVDDTKVYACVTDGDHLYAIDKGTGIVDWSFSLMTATSINVNPLLTEDSIFFGDNKGIVYSLNKDTGIQNWQMAIGGEIPFTIAPVFFDEMIIIGTQNTLYAYDADDGSAGWSYAPAGTIEGSPFVYKDELYLVTSNDGSGQLICLDALDGILKWTFDLTNDVLSSPIVYNDVVYTNDLSKKLSAININTSALNWQIKTNGIITKSPTLVIGNSDEVIYSSNHGLNN